MDQKYLDIECIRNNPYQPRIKYDSSAIEEMAVSIKRFGVLQPLLVRQLNDETYELIAGQRRMEGSIRAGIKKVPVIVKNASDSEMLEMALIENLHREDMSPIEKAMGFKRLIDSFNFTQGQIACLLGISRSAVANTIRLLDLPEDIKESLLDKSITEGHARALLLIKDDKKRSLALKRILQNKLSVRDSETLSRSILKNCSGAFDALTDDTYNFFLDRLMEKLGTKVSIRKVASGGKIEIDFFSEEHLSDISERLLQ